MSANIVLQLALVVALLATVVAWQRRAWALCALLSTTVVLLLGALLVDARLAGAAAGLGVVAVLTVVARRGRTAATVTRWGARSRRKDGVASTFDVARVGSAHAVRRKATVVRPSLAGLSRVQRVRTATIEVAVPLARVGFQRVWSSVEDVTLVFGGPRSGKSGWIAGRIIDAPGAALVTSTRTDLYDLTAGLRARRGPVYVFNASGLGERPSTVTFDPLTGCAQPVTATERATDMLAAGVGERGGEAERWRELAEGALAMLLHAAALGGLSMRTVQEWISDADGGAQREVTSLLRRSPEPGYVRAAEQFFATNDRTRTSITTTMAPALRWLMSPAAAAATDTGGPALDVAALLAERGTVYLLGAREAHTAPLLAALTGHIAREARAAAARRPGGRLDPPLTLNLDEAALVSPVPLPDWTSDMGGRGVTILAAFQSRAQVIDRWQTTGAAMILNNAGATMVFGGTSDGDDLAYWSARAGDRDEPVTTTDDRGRVTSRSVRKTPVLPVAQLANLPAGRVVIFRRGMPPAVGTVRPAWRRRDVRTQLRAERHQHQATGGDADTRTTRPDRTAHAHPGDGPPPAPAAPAWAGDRAPAWVTDPDGTTQEARPDRR